MDTALADLERAVDQYLAAQQPLDAAERAARAADALARGGAPEPAAVARELAEPALREHPLSDIPGAPQVPGLPELTDVPGLVGAPRIPPMPGVPGVPNVASPHAPRGAPAAQNAPRPSAGHPEIAHPTAAARPDAPVAGPDGAQTPVAPVAGPHGAPAASTAGAPAGPSPARAAPAAAPRSGRSSGGAPGAAHRAPTGAVPAADLGVSEHWYQGLEAAVQNLTNPQPPADPRSATREAVATARAVQGVVGSVMGALSVPGDMLNAGFANLTAPLAKVLPAFPAATLTMLYVGMPHTHSHPPSLIPPAPPIPLPSLGSVMLGTSVKVLINGMPAARCGDIGLAPTCCGFAPFFQIKTGSSSVFIGGNRAARMLDICQVCATADTRHKGTINAGAVMGAVGSVARGIQAVQKGMGYAAIAMDAVEAATEDDAALQSAKAMGAAMAAAQMAADAAAAALSKTMGTDPAVISPRSVGAIVIGQPNVMIGGFPMVNIPNPAEMLLKRLSRYKRTPAPKPQAKGVGSCPA